MNLPTKEEIKAHLKMNRAEFPRDLVASKIGTSLSTLNNCLAHKEMTDEMRYNIAKITGMINNDIAQLPQIAPNNLLTFEIPPDSYYQWEKAALKCGETVSDWLINTGNARAEELLASEFGITMFPTPSAAENEEHYTTLKKPHIIAAAGTGIEAEILAVLTDDNIVRVQAYGLSMSPLIEDGEIIEMKHKRASRSPYMKKGLIYLVEMDGKLLIKIYNTRAPRADEKDAEYLTATGSIGQLESINPDFAPIDITEPVEWLAWMTKEELLKA